MQEEFKTLLNLNVVSIEVANKTHNGIARLHCGVYLSEAAQGQIDEIVGSNKNIASAMLLPKEQQLVVEMTTPSHKEDQVKKKLSGFIRALNAWHAKWNNLDWKTFTTRPVEVKYKLVDGMYAEVTPEA